MVCYRMPDYHRLDIGATYFINRSEDSEMSLTFSAYNVYGRENAYRINFEESESDPNKTQARPTGAAAANCLPDQWHENRQ